MGAKDSKPCCITYEEAVTRVSEAELKRLRDAFRRASTLNGIITKQAFIKEVLGEWVPTKLSEHIFQASGGTQKGITFKDLLCGLVLLTRGQHEEKIRFIFCLYANESGSHVVKDEMVKLVQACEGGFVPEAVADCFIESEKVTFDEFRLWLLDHPHATTLTRWLLQEPCSVSLSNDTETPTFYQTLSGVTHLEETDIVELEKRYWNLKAQSRTGKFDMETLVPLISPTIPYQLCEGFFNAFDENRDGHIDFKEMACGISAACRGPIVERQKFCFKIFDRDRDGLLSRKEMEKMLDALVLVRAEARTSDEIDKEALKITDIQSTVGDILKRFDSNLDDAVTLDEYLMWAIDQPLLLDFLTLLFQICHLILGLRPATREEEGEIIRGWLDRDEKHGLQVGQFWYLISMEWWWAWHEYINYQPSIMGSDSVGSNLSLNSASSLVSSQNGSLKRTKLQRKTLGTEGNVAKSNDDPNVIIKSVTALLQEENVATGDSTMVDSALRNGGTTKPSLLLLSQTNAINPGSPKKLLGIGGTTGSGDLSRCNSATPSPNHSPRVIRKGNGSLNSWVPVKPQRPGAIDNLSLIVPNVQKVTTLTGEGGKLKRNVPLMRGREFELVPEAVWNALQQWYGGSPALPRQVILPKQSDIPELELYPICLRLLRHHIPPNRPQPNAWPGMVGGYGSTALGATGYNYSSQTPLVPKKYLAYVASFSRLALLKQVFDFLSIRLRIRLEDMRLWHYRDESNMSLLEEEYVTLEALGFEDNEQVLIEVRNKDQTWPEEMVLLANRNNRMDRKKLVPAEKGATGLNNLGNTCFMNAALQCVSNTQPLTQYFNNNMHLYELNRVNPHGMKGHIAKRYGDLVQDLWSGASRTIAPLKLRWTIGKYAPRFNGFQQHDSQELLAFLLDGLHEDLNRVHDKPYAELKDSDGRSDVIVAQEAWENHILRNKSIIVDLFHGQLKSAVTCKVCGHESVRFDPFNYLSLPLPMESCIHIEVVVFRLDGSIPYKFGLRLNMDEKYKALRQSLSQLCGIPADQIMLAEVVGSMIKTVPGDDQKIKTVIIGQLYAYEIPIFNNSFLSDEMRQTQTVPQIQRTNVAQMKRLAMNFPNNNIIMNMDNHNNNKTMDECIDSNGISEALVPYHASNLSNSSSLISSSIISNSSQSDLGENFHGFVIAYHRKMIRQDIYFLSSQKSRVSLFGMPLVIPCNTTTTHLNLYQSVWVQLSRLVSPLPPSEANVPNHAQDCDNSLGYEFPFTLKAVRKDGVMCAWCQWYRFCRGCRIECCDLDFKMSTSYIAIDWEPTALHLRYQTSQERVFVDHPSVEQACRMQSQPIDLDSCLHAFTKEEELGEDEKYYCSKCKQHQLASKKLQIWRLPPILIIHLKRFQFVNGRWIKSQKIVKFPYNNFDPTNYLASIPKQTVLQQRFCRDGGGEGILSPSTTSSSSCILSDVLSDKEATDVTSNESPGFIDGVESRELSERKENNPTHQQNGLLNDVAASSPQDFHQHRLQEGFDPYNLKYQLYATSCHSGILGGGHYICYARNLHNRWYCYNDSSCKEVSMDQIDSDSAYMLFYERDGIDYERYMPNIEGKVPDTREIEDEFESDFKKLCRIQ